MICPVLSRIKGGGYAPLDLGSNIGDDKSSWDLGLYYGWLLSLSTLNHQALIINYFNNITESVVALVSWTLTNPLSYRHVLYRYWLYYLRKWTQTRFRALANNRASVRCCRMVWCPDLFEMLSESFAWWARLALYTERTSRKVNEARRPKIAAGHMRSTKKQQQQKPRNTAAPEHTMTSTAARRPRPPQQGVRRNKPYALVYTCLLRSRVCGNRPRTAL